MNWQIGSMKTSGKNIIFLLKIRGRLRYRGLVFGHLFVLLFFLTGCQGDLSGSLEQKEIQVTSSNIIVNRAPVLTVQEGGSAPLISFVLEGVPLSPVTIQLQLSDTSRAGLSPATLTFDKNNWNISQSVAITAVDDVLVNGDLSIALSASASSEDARFNSFAFSIVPILVQDNDSSPIMNSVSIVSNNANSAKAKTGDTVTLSFSGDKLLTGLSATILGNSVTVNGTGPYSATYTLMAGDSEGPISFTIDFSDIYGNPGGQVTATTDSSSVTFDSTQPTITSTSISSTNSINPATYAKSGDTISISFTTDEPLGLGAMTSATIMGRAATVAHSGGNIYKATVVGNGADPEGVIVFSINPVDLAGNAGISVNATTDASSVIYDRTNPNATAVTIASNNVNSDYARIGDLITITFTMNETLALGGFTSGTILGNAATITHIAGFNYTATYSAAAMDPEGNSVPFAIQAVDLAGNSVIINATTDASTVTFDRTAPAGYSVSIDNPFIFNGNKTLFSFTFAGAEVGTYYNYSLTSTGGGGPVNGGAIIVAANQQISGIDTTPLGDGTLTLSVTLKDLAGNTGLAVTDTVEKNVAYTEIGAQVTLAEYYDTDGNGRLDHVKVTFDRPIQDSTFDGYNAGGTPDDQVHNVTTAWLIAGRVNVRLDTRDIINTVNPADNGTDDNVLWLMFDEIGTGYDTGEMPDLTTLNSTLKGANGCYVQTSNALQCLVQGSVNIITADVNEKDKAAPIITKGSGTTSSSSFNIVFSEPVDNTIGGGCSSNLILTNIQYIDNSGGNIVGFDNIWSPIGCDGIVQLDLSDGFVAANLTNQDIHKDEIQGGVAPIYDASDNVLDTGRRITVTGSVAPYVLSAVSTSSTTVRITFSEPVDNAAAMAYPNYSISGLPLNDVTLDNLTAIVKITDSIYELKTTAQTWNNFYTIVAFVAISDQDEGLPLAPPDSATFVGAELLRMVSASCTDQSHIQLTFNKDVQTGGGANSADRLTAYKLTGATDLGLINSAVVSANTVTIAHTNLQSGGTYTVIASNGTDGDGFDDAGVGAIQVNGFAEDLLASPNDRASFLGCGTEVVNFTDGPISFDPFGDRSDFGYLTAYQNKVLLGPNTQGNRAYRFEPSGANPIGITFSFNRDTTGGRNSTNSAGLPFYSIGHTGCTVNSHDFFTGCGPDNEDGRGLFASGTISGDQYLFLTGSRSAGDNDYFYWTIDTDTELIFSYIDLSGVFGAPTGNKSTESIHILNDKIYWVAPGDGAERPSVVQINGTAQEGGTSVNVNLHFMDGIGYGSIVHPNKADKVGGIAYDFNDRLYLVNSGSISAACNAGDSYHVGVCEQTGGIVRSSNNDPAACTAADTCIDWVNITPTANIKYAAYFSNVMTTVNDLIPALRPVPAMASFQGKLFMIRNACTVSMVSTGCTGIGCSDDKTCQAAGGVPVPQLWKCDPTSGASNDAFCDADEWSLVAENGATGTTNMNDGNNSHLTLLVANGSYLYVGFDNATTGVQIWRTNSANPTNEGDFSQIGGDGLGNAAANQQIYSATSVQDGIFHYIFVSTGKPGSPVSIYRQKNN